MAKHWEKDPTSAIDRLDALLDAFDGISWTREDLETALRTRAAAMDVSAGKLIHPLRVSLTGNMASPGIFDVLALLGRERSRNRMEDGVERIRRR